MKRDLFENDEIETFDKEDAFEGEHCNICDCNCCYPGSGGGLPGLE